MQNRRHDFCNNVDVGSPEPRSTEIRVHCSMCGPFGRVTLRTYSKCFPVPIVAPSLELVLPIPPELDDGVLTTQIRSSFRLLSLLSSQLIRGATWTVLRTPSVESCCERPRSSVVGWPQRFLQGSGFSGFRVLI